MLQIKTCLFIGCSPWWWQAHMFFIRRSEGTQTPWKKAPRFFASGLTVWQNPETRRLKNGPSKSLVHREGYRSKELEQEPTFISTPGFNEKYLFSVPFIQNVDAGCFRISPYVAPWTDEKLHINLRGKNSNAMTTSLYIIIRLTEEIRLALV